MHYRSDDNNQPHIKKHLFDVLIHVIPLAYYLPHFLKNIQHRKHIRIPSFIIYIGKNIPQNVPITIRMMDIAKPAIVRVFHLSESLNSSMEFLFSRVS